MPMLIGGRYLYARLAPNAERPTIYEFDATHEERVVLDLSQVEPAPRYWVPSEDGNRLAVITSPNAGDALTARVYDVRAAKWLSDAVPGLRWSFPSWAPDGSGFYYTWSPMAEEISAGKRAAESEIRFHLLGADPERDTTVRKRSGVDGAFEIPGISPDGNSLLALRLSGTTGRSLYLGKVRKHAVDGWVEMTPPGSHSYYSMTFGRRNIFVMTDEGAPRRRAFRVDPSQADRAHWKEVLPERPNATLNDLTAIGDFVFYEYLQDAETFFEIRRSDGTLVRELRAPVGMTLGSLTGNVLSNEGSIALSSYTRPYQAYTIRAPKFEMEPFPLGFKNFGDDGYVTEKLFYTSPDGTRAPIFLVHKRAQGPRRAGPLMLYAYGAFGESTEPHYKRDLRVWLERGGMYAEAVVRGGGEYGKDWHVAGMGKNRKNVYDDFLAASDYLVREGWTSSDQLVIRGVSAGGLLVAVAETERPSFFKAVIAEVPITDMVRYPLGHDSGTLWLDEYGSPAKRDEFEVLYRYSPYHRVRKHTHYPMTLIVASENDERLDPMHSRKLAAALDDADPCGTVLLRTEREGGHGGSSRASSWAEESADIYTFALEAVGLAH